MQWDYDIFEENNVLIPQRNCETGYNTCKNIE